MCRSSLGIFVMLLSFLSSCFQSNDAAQKDFAENPFIDFEIKYAKGFSLKHTPEKTLVFIHDPSTGDILDSLDLTGKNKDNTLYFNRIVVQSTTHFAFLQKIVALDKLVGLCGVQYLTKKQKSALHSCAEICNAQGLDVEKVVALHPDLVFLYPFGDQDKIKLNRLGIQTVYLTEYLENSPLARAEWIKFYALITGQNPQATGFEAIEKAYRASMQEKRPRNHANTTTEELNSGKTVRESVNLPRPNSVAFNLPFGDTWDMPSGNSISGSLVRDAGLSYFLDQEKQQGNLLFKLEEAYNHLSQSDYWIIIAARPEDYSLKDLLAENRIYANFPSVHKKHVIFCNTETTTYFSEAPTEPERLLQDLVACLNGDDAGNKYFKILM
jgi:iron complex transport system substrate-binding protein